jgi:alanyl-tRNA synthetase
VTQENTATDKLYLENSYTVSFQAWAISCETLPDGRRAVVLDKTCFYPASGGQLPDRGDIAGTGIDDVWEDDSGTVYHGVAQEVPEGDVSCRIDWERRFDHMQQHTGQHILSRAFIEVGGLDTVSFHMGDDSCTIDLTGGDVSNAIMGNAEALANGIIWENRDVRVRNVASSELPEGELRRVLPEGVTEVRLVEVEGFDAIGCCGTHVRRTGELGAIKILKSERVKKLHRVYFKVGKRALADYADKHDITRMLATRLTTSIGDIADKIDKLQQENQRYRKDLQKIYGSLVAYEKRGLIESARESSGKKFIVYVCEDRDENYLKMLSSELRDEEVVGLLGTKDGFIVCSAGKNIHMDFSESVVSRAKSLGGSGGGKTGFATVRLPAAVGAAEFLEQVYEQIKND